MEAGFVILIATGFLILGIVIGMFLGHSKADRKYKRDTLYSQGTLNVDNSDPEFEPGLFLALAVPVADVISRKYVTLDVNVMLQNSQE